MKRQRSGTGSDDGHTQKKANTKTSPKRKREDDEEEDQKGFMCDNCGASFAQEKQIKNHKSSKKCKETCPKCRVRFSCRDARYKHQKTCEGQYMTESAPPQKKPKVDEHGRFPCERCDVSYKNVWKLNEHLQKCVKVCTLCRQVHEENHMCLGKICCQHCGQEFDEVKNLTAHEATCKTQCQYCYSQFTDVHSLQKHIKYCIRFRVLNRKIYYKSDIFLQEDEGTLALLDGRTNISTPAESAFIVAALCLTAAELPRAFNMNDTPLSSWTFHTEEIFRISRQNTSARPEFAKQKNLLKFQTVLLWCHRNVPLLRSEPPETKSSTFNDCFRDILKKRWDIRRWKTLSTKREPIYTSLDELEEVQVKLRLLEHDASFTALRDVDPQSKMMFDPSCPEEARSIWSSRQIRNLKELTKKEHDLMEELEEKFVDHDFERDLAFEVDELSGSLFEESRFLLENFPSILEQKRAELSKKLQSKGVRKIFTYKHKGAALPEEVDDNTEQHSCGRMDRRCEHCAALLFPGETSRICCTGGKVSLPQVKILNQEHLSLLKNKQYKKFAMILNAHFAMVEGKMRRDSRVPNTGIAAVSVEGRGMKKYTFSDTDVAESWFADPNNHKSMNGEILPENLRQLAEICHILLGNNAFASQFKTIAQQYKGKEEELKKLKIDFNEVLKSKTGSEYTTDEAKGAVKLFYTINEDAPQERRFTVYPLFTSADNTRGKDAKWNSPVIIDDFNQLYELLAYPLQFLYPTEHDGFRLKMPHRIVVPAAATADSDADSDSTNQNSNENEQNGEDNDNMQEDDANKEDSDDRNIPAHDEKMDEDVHEETVEECDDGAEADNAVDTMHEVLRNANNLEDTTPSATFVSAKQYAAYQMHHRPNEDKDELSYNPLLMQGTLTQQFFIDLAMRSIYQRLKYHIVGRGMGYAQKKDIVSGKQIPPTNEISMPTSFERGMPARAQLLNDTLSIYAKYGKADYFLTMTCNPMWEEIQSNLLQNETALDRPDLVHRVFDLKVKELVKDIRKKNVLGENIAMVMVTEYQKRGLPHCHAILWNNKKTSPKDPFNVDHVVHAEIPNHETHPKLYKAVSEYVMHTDCLRNRASPCLQRGKDGKCHCKSNFPKDFSHSTGIQRDGYADVRRRDDGRLSYVDPDVVKKWKDKHKGETTHPNQRSNRWVVPYNAYLLLRYQCHINVEAVRGILAAKYLFKYLFKGEKEVEGEIKEDKETKKTESTAGETPKDTSPPASKKKAPDIHRWLKAHCMTAADACGYLISTKMVRIYPGVTRLHIHLEDEQRVYFPLKNAGADSKRRDAAATSKSTLLAFFEANERCRKYHEGIPGHDAYKGFDSLLYNDVPEFFSYTREKEWKLRPGFMWNQEECTYTAGTYSHRNEGEHLSIGRMYWVPVKDKELHCLRLLLLRKCGPVSFAELRTSQSSGLVHDTFFEAAAELGLIHDGQILMNSMEECKQTTLSSRAIRFTFAMVIIHYMASAADVKKAWDQYEYELCVPALERGERLQRVQTMGERYLYPKEKCDALKDLERLLKEANVKATMAELGLPTPPESTAGQRTEFVLDTERYNEEKMLKKFDAIAPNLNDGQNRVFNTVKTSVEGNQGKIIFLQGAAGTGKTFLYQACLYWARSRRARADQQQQQKPQQLEDRFAIAVATSGIAATLLPGGRTAHSRFKIPIDLESNAKKLCPLDSDHVELLKRTDLIVWDEVVMAQKSVIEVVDRTLRKVRECQQPFGGVTVLLGGDFRQILPVPGKNKASYESIAISLNNSYLWNDLLKMSLTQVMRVKNDDAFREYLMKVGDGSINEDGCVEGGATEDGGDTTAVLQVPRDLIYDRNNQKVTEESLISFTFPGISEGHYENCALLCPTNERQVFMNEKILSRFPGNTITSLSEDTCKDPTAAEFFSTEALNKMDHPRLPPNTLNLKVNCIVMLLKNLDPAGGLCNGTRLVVKEVKKNILVCTNLTEECEWKKNNGAERPQPVAIPRLPCDGDAKDLTIDFTRQQFPVRLSFAMTINKSQGQTLRRVGLDVSQSPCFSHGHLYVAMSRVCSRTDIKICLPPRGDTYLYNCVHQEVISAVEESVGGIKMKISAERRKQLKRDLRLTEADYAKSLHDLAANPTEDPSVIRKPKNLQTSADGESPIDDDEYEACNPACGRLLAEVTYENENFIEDYHPFKYPEDERYVGNYWCIIYIKIMYREKTIHNSKKRSEALQRSTTVSEKNMYDHLSMISYETIIIIKQQGKIKFHPRWILQSSGCSVDV